MQFENILDEITKLGFETVPSEESSLNEVPAIEIFRKEKHKVALKHKGYTFLFVLSNKSLFRDLTSILDDMLKLMDDFIGYDREKINATGSDTRQYCHFYAERYEGENRKKTTIHPKTDCPLEVKYEHSLTVITNPHSIITFDPTRPAREYSSAYTPRESLLADPRITPLIIIGEDSSSLAKLFEKYYFPRENPFAGLTSESEKGKQKPGGSTLIKRIFLGNISRDK